ncbi:protein of unknown function [Dyadobacter soli]|uniref:DUF5013 domain-containing protein n=2 Tax=Dyadobacter soli TaxID=659014 RepID=A0A1G7VHQ7_9BACT|nr:protein of unknown function [Dyadobacter soli]
MMMAVTAMMLPACKVDTLKSVRDLQQKVSLVQVAGGRVDLNPTNVVIDKQNNVLRKPLGIALSGLAGNAGFTIDVSLDFNTVPDGAEKFSPAECYLSDSTARGESITQVMVPAGRSQQAFYLNITRAAIEAHRGKPTAVTLKIAHSSKYMINEQNASALISINMPDFGSRKIDVTDQYIKNASFAREPGTTARFANLADWITNDAMAKSRPTGAGFDANVGYLGIERWGSYDSPIINGKIYQTIQLAPGHYVAEVSMKKVAADKDSYFVVASGAGLPDASGIAGAIATTAIDNSRNNAVMVTAFDIASAEPVSLGFLINIDKGVEKIIQANQIRLFSIRGLFD